VSSSSCVFNLPFWFLQAAVPVVEVTCPCFANGLHVAVLQPKLPVALQHHIISCCHQLSTSFFIMPVLLPATRRGATVPATCIDAVTQFLQQQQPPFSPFIATTVMLMAELARGDASPFAPYFATLPEATDCLLNWSGQERQLLAGVHSCQFKFEFVARLLHGMEAPRNAVTCNSEMQSHHPASGEGEFWPASRMYEAQEVAI
jgi:hypothetical protein